MERAFIAFLCLVANSYQFECYALIIYNPFATFSLLVLLVVYLLRYWILFIFGCFVGVWLFCSFAYP